MQLRSVHRLILLAAVVLGGCHSRGGIVYVVREGDTLASVAHAHNVGVREILRANYIPNPDSLSPGERLLLPGLGEPPALAEEVFRATKAEPETKAAPIPSDEVAIAATEPLAAEGEGKIAFVWPAVGRVVSPYGMRNQRMHNGIDIEVPPGAPITAAAAGTVVYVGDEIEGYGNLLILRHAQELFSVYAYLGAFETAKGRAVKQGETVAKARGGDDVVFIHFEIRRGKQALNPAAFLP